MKSTGIIRKIDELGRIVVPKEIRKYTGMSEGTPVECFLEEDTLIFRKYQGSCLVTGKTGDLIEVEEGRFIHREEAEKIVEKLAAEANDQ